MRGFSFIFWLLVFCNIQICSQLYYSKGQILDESELIEYHLNKTDADSYLNRICDLHDIKILDSLDVDNDGNLDFIINSHKPKVFLFIQENKYRSFMVHLNQLRHCNLLKVKLNANDHEEIWIQVYDFEKFDTLVRESKIGFINNNLIEINSHPTQIEIDSIGFELEPGWSENGINMMFFKDSIKFYFGYHSKDSSYSVKDSLKYSYLMIWSSSSSQL